MTSDRRDDGVHGMRICGVGRDADICKGLNGFVAIQILGDQHEVGMQGGDGFEAGIDGAADFRLLLRFGGEIAVVGVADEKFLQAESVDGLGEGGSEGKDEVERMREEEGEKEKVSD